ncbi:MAG: hypothetical protein JO125_15685, partial [Chloroflexi bacterium]|nr:hypothetical protein [Chloroflexota bacterium]
ADLDLIKFNSSAQERSERTLDGFVRGKIFETKLLRPGGCIGYIALEFTDHKTRKKVTVGCCIEATEKLGRNGERSYFILQEGLDPALFIPEGQPLTRSKLKQALQRRSTGRYYDTVKEYQEDMLDALGGLNRRFFDLFQRALSFKTIKDIGVFVEQWLLPEHKLDLAHLQKVVTRLDDLDKQAKTVRDKLEELNKIVTKRSSYLRQKELQAQYEMLYALLLKEAALRNKSDLEQRAERLHEQLNERAAYRQQLEAVLTGARQAKEQKQKQLYGLDVLRRRDELNREIERLKLSAEEMSKRKRDLLRDLRRIADTLSDLAETSLLATEEQQAIQALLSVVKELGQDLPLPEKLTALVEDAMHALSTALDRAKQRVFTLDRETTDLWQRAEQLKQEIKTLNVRGTSISYPANVEFLRDRLETVLGRRPAILCELLEVPEERWQNAVEAMLGERRFNIIVPPHSYDDVLTYIDRDKGNRRMHDASVLDLERAYEDRRPARPGSLALQVTTKDKYLRAYIDSILGKIVTCSSAQELRQYHRAITSELIYYSEWAVRVLSAERYQPWVVGQRARKSQIEAREREIRDIAAQLAPLDKQLTHARGEEQQLNLGNVFARILQKLESPPDDSTLLAEIASCFAERDALDLSIVDELQHEIDQLDIVIKQEEAELSELIKFLGALEREQEQVRQDKRMATNTLLEKENELVEVMSRYTAQSEAESLFVEQSQEPDLTQASANASRAAKTYTTQSDNSFREFQKLGTEYNLRYQFAGLPLVPHDTRYSEEHTRLQESELPDYLVQIEQTRQEALQELREHVLHILRERISYAERELQRMNDALKPLDFHGDRYRFRWEAARDMQDYYRLIMNSQVIGSGPLFESEFYRTHQEAFDTFYNEVTRISLDDSEKATKARLADYRTYLEYDIEIMHSDGRVSRLSRIMGQTSGGETQTPFYLAVAASFVQLYRMGVGEQRKTRNERPAIRLAVFDEAFSKMDQSRIGATLDMFLQYGLQVVTATPLERCEYLVPKMCTNLVLTVAGENVLIEEYRNYAAQLTEQLEAVYGD